VAGTGGAVTGAAWAGDDEPDAPCGLIVDWGGVMTTNVFASFNAFCAAEGLEPDRVTRVFLAEPGRGWLAGLETGDLPEHDFERNVAGLLGVDPARLIERLMAGARPDPVMLRAVRRARAHGIATGLISNSWGVSRYNADDLRELFDGTVISGLVGLRKPDPVIYEMGARAVRLRPRECVYVDDLGGNLKPARALGMTTVLHTTAVATVAELSGIFGVDLA
jgi:putative hydrolase of the HAD superfamily